jgi:catechol 2,3-dioxygenase-like lactoylglutathione lyase family enzyme
MPNTLDRFRTPAFRRVRSRQFGRTLLAAVIFMAAVQYAIAFFSCRVHAEGTESAAVAPVRAVGAISIVVSDLDEVLPFYTDVLTFEKIVDSEITGNEWEHLSGVFGSRVRVARLRLGGEEIELIDYLVPEGRPIPIDSRSNDGWFQHIAIITPDMARAYAHLRQHKIRHASAGPQRLPDWNKNAGGIEAFYFKDPDSHVLEILAFPPDKGDPKWRRLAQENPHAFFLGIDHTAIVVGDTEASLRFYRDRLGFRVAGESENYGPVQERLNNVFGARLRITGLKLQSGPAIEFLEYLTPGDGRPYPHDSRANDLWSWQTTLLAPSGEAAASAVPLRDGRWVSSGIQLDNFIVRDPDGHLLRIAEAQNE